MDYTGITFGLDVLISIVFGASGAIGVWFKMKGSVNIQALKMESLEAVLKKIENDYKEDKITFHKRIDSNKALIDKNRENSDTGINQMTTNMNAMELRIIKAIHEIKS